jgi:hypothetical protein
MKLRRSRSRRRWGDLRRGERAGVLAAGGVQLGLLAAALADLRRRSADEIRGDKRLWTAAAFINFVGPIAYFAFGRRGSGLR